jgi:hypothetical protein
LRVGGGFDELVFAIMNAVAIFMGVAVFVSAGFDVFTLAGVVYGVVMGGVGLSVGALLRGHSQGFVGSFFGHGFAGSDFLDFFGLLGQLFA